MHLGKTLQFLWLYLAYSDYTLLDNISGTFLSLKFIVNKQFSYS